MKKLHFSVVIPLYATPPRFFSDLLRFCDQTYRNFEILIVSDHRVSLPSLGRISARLILTRRKSTGPATKRDIALKHAAGEICAFIDDDAYPHPDWLRNAALAFSRYPQAVAIGGPGLTPPEDGYWEQLAGLVYTSVFCSGKAQHRFVCGSPQAVTDWPAYNLFIKTSVLKSVGGYGNDFYGGEDTFLCLKLMPKGVIRYDPFVVVYHHRRPLFWPLLRQIYNVGLHRGYFAKKFPATSRKYFYFLPSLLTLGLFSFLVGSLLDWKVFAFSLLILASLLFIAAISVYAYTDIKNALVVGLGVIATHLTYGLGFIRGLLTPRLTR